MVSEGVTGVMSACADFTQNAWKKDLCVNCQRPRAEHMDSGGKKPSSGETTVAQETPADSPKPAKRNSLMTKSWTILQASEKTEEESEDDKWAAMCLPSTEPLDKCDNETGKVYRRREHCYEDIDGESMKQNAEEKASVKSDIGANKNNSEGASSSKKSAEDRSSTFIQDSNKLGSTRSRSSSREKSPAPALRPKPVLDKPKVSNEKEGKKVETNKDTEKGRVSPRSRKKLKKNQKSLSFVDDKPEIIGEDGGMDNLYLDAEDDNVKADANDTKEILEFTEDEKEWALQALKNTLWNTDHIGAEDKTKEVKQSKEYEDVQIQSLLEADRFANVRECDPLPDKQNFGTFPLRTKLEKSAIDNMFTGNRLSTLSETLENIGETGDDSQSKYDSVMKFLNGGKLDITMSPKRQNAGGDKSDLNNSDISESNYDDPWGDKFAFDADSEMNLLDEIKGEIDLDSSNAGFALVDLLNDVLSKYSTGSPSETDSVKNLDSLDDDKADKIEGKEKPTELEAKMVTLAASLRKQRAKGRAPRPPSCPPEPPQDVLKSPVKQLELRAAQSKEPTFKMVPHGKPIGGNPLSQSVPAPTTQKAETLPLSSSTPENMEGYKIKAEKEKDKQKKGGGIGSFFSRILRRGRDSETDLLTSSETLVSQTGSDVQSDSDNQSDKGSYSDRKSDKSDRRSSKSSPQMKLKVLPGRPQSPKGGNSDKHSKVAAPDIKKDTELEVNEAESSKANQDATKEVKESPIPQPKSKDNLSEVPSQPNIKPEPAKPQLSPNKTNEKAVSPKSKEAPPLPLNPPRETSDPVPKPRARGNSDGGPPRSRPRTRDMTDAKPRDTPNIPPPKPPVAAKPRPPSIQTKSLDISESIAKTSSPKKEPLTATSSLDDEVTKASKAGQDPNGKVDAKVLRKRAKSPKRYAAPAAPVRASMPNISAESSTSINSTSVDISTGSLPASVAMAARADQKVPFAKELELKLSKEQHPAVNEMRKISMPAPPPSPPIAKPDSIDTNKTASKDKDITKEVEKSKSSSRDDLKLSPPLHEVPKSVTPETEPVSITPPVADMPIQHEKIELPRPAGSSRKSFLGKLNRKNKPPPPPSVKRTKSITEASISAEHHLKKIDVKDISGPVVSILLYVL